MIHSKRKIAENNNAVSAVIGVTLMVAVAIAMAAVAYAFLTGMVGNTKQPAPAIDFYPDDGVGMKTLMITSSSSDIALKWQDLSITAKDATHTVNLVSTSGKIGTDTITMGEKLLLNGKGLTGTVTVTIVHLPSSTMMGEYTFTDITT